MSLGTPQGRHRLQYRCEIQSAGYPRWLAEKGHLSSACPAGFHVSGVYYALCVRTQTLLFRRLNSFSRTPVGRSFHHSCGNWCVVGERNVALIGYIHRMTEISCIAAHYSQVLHFNNNSNDCNDTFPLYRTFHPKRSYSYSLAVTKEVGNTQCKAAIFITRSVGCGIFHTIEAILESSILLLLCNPSTVQTLLSPVITALHL